jgi:hypothetical protein
VVTDGTTVEPTLTARIFEQTEPMKRRDGILFANKAGRVPLLERRSFLLGLLAVFAAIDVVGSATMIIWAIVTR